MITTPIKISSLALLVLAACCGAVASGGSKFKYSCPSNTSHCSSFINGTARTPIYILVMVPFPDERKGAGWDYGMQVLPGGRIARDFINCNLSDLLPGYHLKLIETNHEACGITNVINEAYINFARFGLHEECGGPVVAVAGLVCSPSTALVSRVAGRSGVHLTLLSNAGSPIFDAGPDDAYSHLWRYVSSASAYVETAIEIMKRLKWKRVGLIQDLVSEFYFNLGKKFNKAVHQSNNFTIEWSFGIESLDTRILENVIHSIKESKVRIIFSSTTLAQSTFLMCRAVTEGLLAPRYLWIFPDIYIEDFEKQISRLSCEKQTFYKGLNGTLLLQYNFISKVTVVRLPGGVFHNYNDLYNEYLQDVLRDFNYKYNEISPAPNAVGYSHLLFDQIWSFAYTLNQSLPQLQKMNISIGTFGNAAFTDVLEDNLSRLNLSGITGHIHFNNKKFYPTEIKIVYQTTVNTTNIKNATVGMFYNGSLLWLNLTEDDVPKDREDPMTLALHNGVIVVLYLTIFTVISLTTAVLALFWSYRNKPEVKAASPYLSMFMFAGCYSLCLAALLRITYGGFGGQSIFGTLFEFLCGLEFFIDQNGHALILVTLFIKLLRVHQIFNNKKLQELSDMWKNSSLALIVVGLCSIPNILSVIIINAEMLNYNNSIIPLPDIRDTNGARVERQVVSCKIQNTLWNIISYVPLVFYLALATYLAITMRKITNKNFKDTKKVNIFVVVYCLLFVTYIASWGFLLLIKQILYITVVQSLFPLAVTVACQVILFLPKVIPVVWIQMKNLSNKNVSRKSSATSTTGLTTL